MRISAIHGTLLSIGVWMSSSAVSPSVRAAREPRAAERWEEAIGAFEAADRAHPPEKRGVLFVGSSTIRLWDTSRAFAAWHPINRGFGGSTIADVNRLFDRVVAPYAPRVIVFYSGDNDIQSGRSAADVASDFAMFAEKVRAVSAETRIVFLSIKASVRRWDKWAAMRDANERIRAILERDGRGTYVDTAPAMLGDDGKPRADLLKEDGLHLNDAGYRAWNALVEPALDEAIASHPPDRLESDPRASLTFHATFDRSFDADSARGDGRARTASDPSRKDVQVGVRSDRIRLVDGGRWGRAVEFAPPKTPPILIYAGEGNVPHGPGPIRGTVAFWMALTPDEDLEPGFVDPLQVTDKEWNNACLFVDFSKDERPRHFRLGVFSDYAYWNPMDRTWDAIAESERPMIPIRTPPFRRDAWTHVAFTFHGFNTEAPAPVVLYLDGVASGSLASPHRFTWDPARLAILLGIEFNGRIDDLAIFDRALFPHEIRGLVAKPIAEPR